MENVSSNNEEQTEVAYSYDEGRLDAIRTLITDAYQDASSYHDIASRIFSTSLSPETPAARAEAREVASIFYYRFHVERGPDAKPGASLEPLSDTGNSHYWPPPIRTVDAEVRQLWSALLNTSTEPEIQGLSADLLFSARNPKPHLFAQQAVEAYIASQAGKFSELHKSEMLVRAWTIVRSLSLKSSECSVEHAMTSLTEATLTADNSAPGVAFPLIRCLLQGRMKDKRASGSTEFAPGAVDYLFSALERYKEDYLSLELANMARDYLKDPALVDQALRQTAANLLEEAELETHGFLRTYRLEQTAKFARRFHLDDVHATCVRLLQRTDPSTFPWTTIRASSAVRASDIESYLRLFDRPCLTEALACFFETPAPSGSREQNEKLARELMENSLTAKIMGTATYGAHGLPQKSYNTEEEKFEYQVNTVESMGLSLQGSVLSAILDRMAAAHTIPEIETLHAWLIEMYGSDPGLCLSLAHSLSLYWRGDYIACVQLAMPRIEAAIRSLLVLLNEPIYRVEEEKSPGQFPGLGFMLPQLAKHGFDPDWSSFIRALLLTPGRNLRNLGAHGFIQDVDKHTAALIIRALAVIALLAPEESSKQANATLESGDAFLSTPRLQSKSILDRVLIRLAFQLNKALMVRSIRR
ncbi:hypothetical protein ACOZGD_20445 [Streptomyces murinus]